MCLTVSFSLPRFCGFSPWESASFSYLTIAILNMIEKGYLYIYIALALAIIYGISHHYHD